MVMEISETTVVMEISETTVVMDRSEYRSILSSILQDEATYQERPK